MSLMSSFSFLQASSPYSGEGNTNCMAEWYRDLAEETKAHICAAGFKPIVCLLPERLASTILVQSLAERWWDTTYTFHIA